MTEPMPRRLSPVIEKRDGGVAARCPLCPWETEVRPLRVEARVLFEADHALFNHKEILYEPGRRPK